MCGACLHVGRLHLYAKCRAIYYPLALTFKEFTGKKHARASAAWHAMKQQRNSMHTNLMMETGVPNALQEDIRVRGSFEVGLPEEFNLAPSPEFDDHLDPVDNPALDDEIAEQATTRRVSMAVDHLLRDRKKQARASLNAVRVDDGIRKVGALNEHESFQLGMDVLKLKDKLDSIAPGNKKNVDQRLSKYPAALPEIPSQEEFISQHVKGGYAGVQLTGFD